MKFTADVAGSVTGVRFYKASRQHRHARRRAVERGRDASWLRGRFSGETASGWQTLTFAHAGGGDRRHDLRRHLPGAERALLGHRRGLRRRAARQPAAARARQRHQRRTASTRTARRPCSRPARGTPPTTGWTSCSPRAAERTHMRKLSLIALRDRGGRAGRVRRRRPARLSSSEQPAGRQAHGAGGDRRLERGRRGAQRRPRATRRCSSASRASRAAASRPATS